MAVGRPPSCVCGNCKKCKQRIKERERYRSLSIEERRAIVESRNKELERKRDRARNSTPARMEHLKQNTARWRKANPEKAAAHRKVRWAVESGKLIPQPCEVEGCGSTKVHAHHDDYSKPLDVRWLCPLHHAAERGK